jgi:hypothetical protein
MICQKMPRLLIALLAWVLQLSSAVAQSRSDVMSNGNFEEGQAGWQPTVTDPQGVGSEVTTDLSQAKAGGKSLNIRLAGPQTAAGIHRGKFCDFRGLACAHNASASAGDVSRGFFVSAPGRQAFARRPMYQNRWSEGRVNRRIRSRRRRTRARNATILAINNKLQGPISGIGPRAGRSSLHDWSRVGMRSLHPARL